MSDTYVSPLHRAVTLRNPGWVKRLLDNGANPNVDTKDQFSLFELSLINRDSEIAVFLRQAGAQGIPQVTLPYDALGYREIYTLRDGTIGFRRLELGKPNQFG